MKEMVNAMYYVAKHGYHKRNLEARDIYKITASKD